MLCRPSCQRLYSAVKATPISLANPRIQPEDAKPPLGSVLYESESVVLISSRATVKAQYSSLSSP
ncbi:hypothetical protein ACLOJK_010100 [Asimina triloba]